ncbi:hypothetical protein KJ975_05585 [Myxococcota bacterium]|nr:hypothetical protein [Myxococcota bacterium]
MEQLTAIDWIPLIRNVFAPDSPMDRGVAFLIDVPDDVVPDNPDWKDRRDMTVDWAESLRLARAEHGWDVAIVAVPNVHRNNADLPATGYLWTLPVPPGHVRDLARAAPISFSEAFSRWSMWVAPTEFSATAPLKLAARARGDFRAATMPGFNSAMIPALRLPYDEINRRVFVLKDLLDPATGADLEFHITGGPVCRLHLDLRHRTAHASGGVLRENGLAGNLPSGEAYMVPYEGELSGDPSRTAGVLPVELDGEVVRYVIRENRAVEVQSEGPVSEAERARLLAEPAYGNLAELGLGVLDAFGVEPTGEVLLDEKLGLHIAFGRSDHFGGQVGAAHFSSPEAVVHIDRVYVPRMQPKIPRVHCTLILPDRNVPLLQDCDYVIDFS